MESDAVLVDFRARLRIVDDLRQHALGILADFDWRLAGPGSVDCEVPDAGREDGAETLGEIFFAAIEAVNRDDERNGAFRILRQA